MCRWVFKKNHLIDGYPDDFDENFKLTSTPEGIFRAFYIEEFKTDNSHAYGTGSLNKYLRNGRSYDEWMEYTTFNADEINFLNSDSEKVPAETYFLVRESDNKIIGMINIRLRLNDDLKRFGGHIGYSIRPTERRKGYNKINLYLGLKKCAEHGIDRVMIDCAVDNIGSDKTIKSLGGVLERTELDSSDNELVNVYWINVKQSLTENEPILIKRNR